MATDSTTWHRSLTSTDRLMQANKLSSIDDTSKQKLYLTADRNSIRRHLSRSMAAKILTALGASLTV